MSRFKYFPVNGCVGCGCNKDTCRYDSKYDLIYCHTLKDTILSPGDEINGLYYFGKSNTPPSILLTRDDRVGNKRREYKEDRQAYVKRERERKAKAQSEATAEQERLFKKRLSDEERDFWLRKLIDEIKSKNFPENKRHEQDFIKRGIPLDYAREHFLSVPSTISLSEKFDNRLNGVSKDGMTFKFWWTDSYTCFLTNEKGQYIGIQPATLIKGNKYVHVTAQHDPELDYKLKDGEAPVNYVNHGSEFGGFTEGPLKSREAARRHQKTFVGLIGGNSNKCQKQIKRIIQSVSGGDLSLPIPLNLDANSLLDGQVFDRWIKTHDLIASWGFKNIFFPDWGQLDKPKGHPEAFDIDEIDPETPRTNLSIEELKNRRQAILNKELQDQPDKGFFGNIIGFGQRILRSKLRQRKIEGTQKKVNYYGYEPGQIKSPDQTDVRYIEFKNGQRAKLYEEAARAGYKYIFDKSGTGTGKTFSVDELHPDRFFLFSEAEEQEAKIRRLFHLSQSPRNPNTAGIEENFEELPARTHTGYIKNYTKFTPLGKPFRESFNQNKATGFIELTSANCINAEKFTVYREKNIPTEGLCAACPMSEKCKIASGDGYGYRYEAREALKSQFIRAHSMAIGDEMINHRDIGIIDEYVAAIDPTHYREVTLKDINDTLTFIEKNVPQALEHVELPLSRISRMLSNVNKCPNFGYNHLKTQEKIGNAPENTIALVQLLEPFRKPLDKDTNSKGVDELRALPKFWITDFLRVWGQEHYTDSEGVKKPQGCFWVIGDKLIIITRNNRILDTLKRFHCTVFQDATGSVTELSLWLGVSPDEILVVKQEEGSHENLVIKHVVGLGKCGKERSDDLQRRVDLLVEQLKKNHGEKNVGFIDFKAKAKEGWLTHFVDGRGSNAYQEKDAVCSIGAPYQSLSGIQNLYQALTGEFFDLDSGIEGTLFQKYFNDRLQAEILQEIGRLRHNRRNKQVTFYLCCDIDTQWLKDMGYTVEEVHVGLICPDAASAGERTQYALVSAFKSLTADLGKSIEEASRITLSEICDLAGRKISNASSTIKSIFGSWSDFRKFLVTLIYKTEAEPKISEDQEAIADYIKSLLGLSDDEFITEVGELVKAWGIDQSLCYFRRLDGETKQSLINSVLRVTSWQWIPLLR